MEPGVMNPTPAMLHVQQLTGTNGKGGTGQRSFRGYLQDEAEVRGRSELLFVVFGDVDVQLVKADEAGEVSGALQDRQVEKQER